MSLLMGARGVGALIGPLVASRIAGHRHSRLRLGDPGRLRPRHDGLPDPRLLRVRWPSPLPPSYRPCRDLHRLGLLHDPSPVYTTDRFRGRVFAAEFGICMLAISTSSYLAGLAIDWGASPRAVAIAMGSVMACLR